MTPLLRNLSGEKIMLVKSAAKATLPFPITGIIRMINSKGDTVAIVFGSNTLAEIAEDLEAAKPDFLATLDRSRASGRVSSKEVKYKTGHSRKK